MRLNPIKTRARILAVLLTGVTLAAAGCGKLGLPTPEPVVETIAPSHPAAKTLITPVTTLVPEETAFPAVSWAQTPPCDGQPACVSLFVTQAGQVSRMSGSAKGFQAQGALVEQGKTDPWIIDTGSPSPDGKWVAYTSIGSESGGPIFLQNLETGEWTNLIQTVNERLPEGQDVLDERFGWDVIGWFPDSQRLLLGPYDLGRVDLVNISSYEHKMIPINTPGLGGKMVADLSPDGSGFVYIGSGAGDTQILYRYDFASEQAANLLEVPYEEGILQFPRYSPDGKTVAYLTQKGHPTTGMTYSIDLYSPDSGVPRALVEGNLGLTVPTWSPDGQSIAFTKKEPDEPDLAGPEITPLVMRGNVWVVSVTEEKLTQVTFIDGRARTPVWAEDGKTLAFVTHDGQVGLANTDQPGQIWQAAGPSPASPDLTSVFFVP